MRKARWRGKRKKKAFDEGCSAIKMVDAYGGGLSEGCMRSAELKVDDAQGASKVVEKLQEDLQ